MFNLEMIRNISVDGVFVFGAGGHAKVVAGLLSACGRQIVAFVDDKVSESGSQFLERPLLHPDALAEGIGKGRAIIAIGDNWIRQRKAQKWTGKLTWDRVVHPWTWTDKTIHIEKGSVVLAGAVIQADVTIGSHVIINTRATIDHDCRIDDYSHIAPGACLAGNVSVGTGSFIGIGTSVIPGIQIGKGCVVGAGAVVVKDIPDYCLAVGVPARIIRRFE